MSNNRQLNPIFTALPDALNSLQTRIKALETARQPYLGDWNDFATPFSVVNVGNSTISFTDLTIIPSNFFGQGDKIKYFQDGGWKYAYVSSVSSLAGGTITLVSGSDYTLTSSSITALSRGLSATPLGFPILFRFAPAITGITGAYSNPDPTNDELCYFAMIGKIVNLYISVTSGAVGTTSYVGITPPVTMDSKYYRGLTIIGGPTTGWYESTGSGGIFMYGNLVAPYKFATGGGNVNFAVQLSYNAA